MEATDSERGVVGAAILWCDRMDDIRAIVRPGDFFQTIPRKIFTALCAQDDRRKPWDLVTVGSLFDGEDPPQEGRTWTDEAVDLARESSNTAQIPHHARLVRARGQKGRAQHLLAAMSADLADTHATPEEMDAFLGELTAKVASLAGEGLRARDECDAVEAMQIVVDRHKSGQTVQGLSTDLKDLDDIVLGLRAGELILVGARPGAGKTALALQIAINVAMAGTPGLFLSLEMTTDSLAQRLLSNLAEIDSGCMRRGDTGVPHWRDMDEAVADMKSRKSVKLISESGTTLPRLRGYLRNRQREGLLGFAVIDYLQLMRHPGAKDQNVEVSEISRGLKEIAIEFAIPVLALSQLNRDADGTDPKMANLRSSGALEQDADVVVLLSQGKDGEFLSGQVAKNRHGRTGDFKLSFMRNFFRIRLATTSEEIYR